MRGFSPDRSTLAVLEPAQPVDLQWRVLKNSIRIQGSHLLALRRPAKAPESSRKYVKGDPVNMIDWKAYARTDQLVIRERRDEASAIAAIAVDMGATMQWPPADSELARALPTKLEIALRTALNLAYLHLFAGDVVDVFLIGDEQKSPSEYFRPRNATDIQGLFEHLNGKGFSAEVLKQTFTPFLGQRRPRTDVGYWLSDGLGRGDHQSFLATSRQRFFMHVLSSAEVDIDWVESASCYFDEWVEKKEYQGAVLVQQESYQRALSKWRSDLSARLKRASCYYSLFTDKTPISEYHSILLHAK